MDIQEVAQRPPAKYYFAGGEVSSQQAKEIQRLGCKVYTDNNRYKMFNREFRKA